MKKLLLILMVAGTMGCEKGEVTKSNELTGTWRWVRTTGGLAGVNETPGAGEVRILKLNADKTYTRLLNDSLLSRGSYMLTEEESMLWNKKAGFIQLEAGLPMMYQVKNDELQLTEDVYDGFNYTYQRK